MTPIGATASFLRGGTRPSALPWPGFAGLVAVAASGLLWLEDAAPGTPLELLADFFHLLAPAVIRQEIDLFVGSLSLYWLLLTLARYGATWVVLYQGWQRAGEAWAGRNDRQGTGPVHAHRPFAPSCGPTHGHPSAEPPPRAGAWERAQRVQVRWDHLARGACGAARASVTGAFIRRFERRWHTLGERLKSSKSAKWFRAGFLSADHRRAWTPVAFRWWEDDPRTRWAVPRGFWRNGRHQGEPTVYYPDLEGGPDPSPWFDWPAAHRVWGQPEDLHR